MDFRFSPSGKFKYFNTMRQVKMEFSMDKSELLSVIDAESRPSKSKATKRKWREIEAIHDRYRLRQELQELGMTAKDELEMYWSWAWLFEYLKSSQTLYVSKNPLNLSDERIFDDY